MMMTVGRADHRGRERVNNQSPTRLAQWELPFDELSRDFFREHVNAI